MLIQLSFAYARTQCSKWTHTLLWFLAFLAIFLRLLLVKCRFVGWKSVTEGKYVFYIEAYSNIYMLKTISHNWIDKTFRFHLFFFVCLAFTISPRSLCQRRGFARLFWLYGFFSFSFFRSFYHWCDVSLYFRRSQKYSIQMLCNNEQHKMLLNVFCLRYVMLCCAVLCCVVLWGSM